MTSNNSAPSQDESGADKEQEDAAWIVECDEFDANMAENHENETSGPLDYGNEDPEDDREDAFDDVLKIIENPKDPL